MEQLPNKEAKSSPQKTNVDSVENPSEEVLQKKPFLQKITRSDFGKSKIAKRGALAILALLVLGIIFSLIQSNTSEEQHSKFFNLFTSFAEPRFLGYIAIGFIAQMIDGALGMAYGASSMTMLTSFGVSASIANSCIKLSEVFTTSASGFSHWKLGNINKKLVKNLILPGVIGAFFGALLIAYVDSIEGLSKTYVKPIISIYILLLGVYIIYKALLKKQKKTKTKRLSALATFGGFMDAAGGGGWGPIVTSTLISSGRSPKYTIGSVNLSEFFIALTSAVVITLVIGLEEWYSNGINIAVGLILGGIIAAPMGAIVASKIKAKPLMLTVGTLIILVNSLNIYKAWFR